MKTLAIFLVMINFLTGSLSSIKTELMSILDNPVVYPLQSLAIQLIKPEPIRNPLAADPEIEATSVIVIDANTGKVLFEKNPNQRLAIASLTKIMTALVVLKYSTDIQNTIRVSKTASMLDGSQMYLRAGEVLTIEDLLKGALIESANDAAYALADGIMGSSIRFVDAMNQYAKQLELKDTYFSNSYGADGNNHYSTAQDLAKLTTHALQNEIFRSIVNIQETTITDVTNKFKHKLKNTNKLVGAYINVIGVKTGTTLGAGASLVAAATGDSNQTVIAVLLDSPARFTEGKLLLDWALKSYTWIELL